MHRDPSLRFHIFSCSGSFGVAKNEFRLHRHNRSTSTYDRLSSRTYLARNRRRWSEKRGGGRGEGKRTDPRKTKNTTWNTLSARSHIHTPQTTKIIIHTKKCAWFILIKYYFCILRMQRERQIVRIRIHVTSHSLGHGRSIGKQLCATLTWLISYFAKNLFRFVLFGNSRVASRFSQRFQWSI